MPVLPEMGTGRNACPTGGDRQECLAYQLFDNSGPTGIDRIVQADRGTSRRTLAALKACKTTNANNSDVIGRVGFAPARMAA